MKFGPELKLHHVKVFLEAAQRKNFSEAAKHLNISNAALSQAIASLERDLGRVELFKRATRGAELTDAGRIFIGHAKTLLDAAEDARRAVESLATAEVTLLRVAYQPSFASIVLDVLEQHMRRNRHLAVEAYEDVSKVIYGKVKDRKVDVGIAYIPKDLDVELKPDEITTNRLSLIASSRHSLSRQETVQLAALANEPFAVPWMGDLEDDVDSSELTTAPGALSIRKMTKSYFEENGFRPKSYIFQGNTIDSVLAIVRANLAVTIHATLEFSARDDLCVKPLEPPAPIQATGFILRKDADLSQAATTFMKDVRDRFRGSSPGGAAPPSNRSPIPT